MNILIAADSFKGSLMANEVVKAMEKGIKTVDPDANVFCVPLSDGGEGLVAAMIEATGGNIFNLTVTGPLGEPVDAVWGLLGDGSTAVIEMASASGLTLVPENKRNPLYTTTFGTGELIMAALDENCKKIILGLGGSSTNDGGSGMAQALGVKLLNKSGDSIGFGGRTLLDLATIDISEIDKRLEKVEVLIACDVDNVLTGPTGASRIFAPQKGADEDMVVQLDKALSHYAKIIMNDLGVDVEFVPGSGAAGGLGAGVMAFTKGRLVPGIKLVMNALEIEKYFQHCDLVLTGEGRFDRQSLNGKVPIGLARLAKNYGLPVVVIAGSVANNLGDLQDEGVTAYFSIINEPLTLQEAMQKSAILLEKQTAQVIELFSSIKN